MKLITDDSDGPQCVQHQPKQGTFTRDKDGEPGDLLNHWDYPVRAVCMHCEASIVTYGMFGSAADWYDDSEIRESNRRVDRVLGIARDDDDRNQ